MSAVRPGGFAYFDGKSGRNIGHFAQIVTTCCSGSAIRFPSCRSVPSDRPGTWRLGQAVGEAAANIQEDPWQRVTPARRTA